MDAASTTSSAASSAEGRSGSGSDFINRGMFASGGSQPQQSGSGENLLVGGAGGGFSLGNGFGNDSTGLGGGGPVSAAGTSFDLSDFPSLGGGAVGGGGAIGGGGGGAAPGPGNGLAAALREQQQLLAHQQQQQQQQMLQAAAAAAGGAGGSSSQKGTASSNLQYMLAMTGSNGGNFNMATEDFPALGGGAPSQSTGVGNGSLNVSSLLSNSSSIQQSSSNDNGLYGGSGGLDTVGSQQLEGGAGLLGGAGLAGLGGLRNPGSTLSSAPSGSAPAGAIGSSVTSGGGSSSGVSGGNALTGDYGLLGLLGVIRMTESDRNSLALGSDLQLFGLNMGPAEQIYNTFSSPWTDTGATRAEPHYQVRWSSFLRCVIHPYLRFSDLTPSPFAVLFSKAANVLLHATSCAENRTSVQISVRDPVLHLLRTTEGCPASICSARAVRQGMEIPRGTETVVQESRTLRRSSKLVQRVATVLVL